MENKEMILDYEIEFARIQRKDSVLSVRLVKRDNIPPCVDMRLFKFNPSGEEYSTSKGFTLFLEHIPTLIEALQKISDARVETD